MSSIGIVIRVKSGRPIKVDTGLISQRLSGNCLKVYVNNDGGTWESRLGAAKNLKDCEWIFFLDDDDILLSPVPECFLNDADIVVFGRYDVSGNYIPPQYRHGRVGLFSVAKRDLVIDVSKKLANDFNNIPVLAEEYVYPVYANKLGYRVKFVNWAVIYHRFAGRSVRELRGIAFRYLRSQECIDFYKEYKFMNYRRVNVIQDLIIKFCYKKYLEIGVSHGNIICNLSGVEKKVAIDPVKKFEKSDVDFFQMKSRDFWIRNKEKFDLIFIDGDHSYLEAKNDIENALKCLNYGGCIVIHDTLNINEYDVFKAFLEVVRDKGGYWFTLQGERVSFGNLGITVWFPYSKNKLQLNFDVDWNFGREYLLNLISPQDFIAFLMRSKM